jgi:hypothetical protein
MIGQIYGFVGCIVILFSFLGLVQKEGGKWAALNALFNGFAWPLLVIAALAMALREGFNRLFPSASG